MAARRRAHLRLFTGLALFSLPVAATSTSALQVLPVAAAASSQTLATSTVVSPFSGGLVTAALSGTSYSPGTFATTAVALPGLDLTRQLAEAGRERLQAASPDGTEALDGVDLDEVDVPRTALVAYQVAATTMAQADPDCGVDWSLLAAIGRVETDHGRYGGATLRSDGTSHPAIRGVALDGKGPVQAIEDTDGGRLDGDERWDRAVGPMQFLPATWSYAGVDADGDGVRSPDNINDAALAAAVYLCAAPGNLDNRAALREAVHRYNPSDTYVAMVLELAEAYRDGDVTAIPTDGTTLALDATRTESSTPAQPGVSDGAGGSDPAPGGGTSAGGSQGRGGSDDQDGDQDRDQDKDGNDGTRGDAELDGGPVQGQPGDRHEQPEPPTKEPKPTDEPDPDPTDEPEPEPVLIDVTGLLAMEQLTTEDGELYDQYYLDEVYVDEVLVDDVLLDLGDEEWLATTASEDLDGDYVLETNLEEIDGLLGTEVVLTVEEDTVPAVVHAVNALPYLIEE